MLSTLLTALLLTITAQAQAQAPAPACSDVFSASGNRLMELVRLRLDIEAKNAGGHRDVARMLYVNFQNLHAKAVADGVNLSQFENLLARAKVNATESRENASQIEQRLKTEARQDMSLWTRLDEIELPDSDAPLLFTPDGHSLIYERSSREVVIRNLSNKQELTIAKSGAGGLGTLSPNWQLGLFMIRDKFSQPYEIRSLKGELIRRGETMLAALSPTADIMAVEQNRQIELIEATTGHPLTQLTPPWTVNSHIRVLNFSPDGKVLYINSIRESWIYDLATGTYTEFPAHTLMAAAMSPVDHRVVVARGEGVVDIIDPHHHPTVGEPTVKLKGMNDWIAKLWFSADGKRIFGETTKPVKLHVWSAKTGELIKSFNQELEIKAAASSDDATAVAFLLRNRDKALIRVVGAPNL